MQLKYDCLIIPRNIFVVKLFHQKMISPIRFIALEYIFTYNGSLQRFIRKEIEKNKERLYVQQL